MLEWATDYFEEKGVPSSRLSIEWILADVLEIKRLDIYLQFDRPLSEDELNKIRPMVKRRAQHEPLQYITGQTDFINSVIKVSPGVLIPRVETEQLVEILLEEYKSQKNQPLKLLDIGTGSGCIPVSIKKEYESWNCTGLDISPDALEIARQNAEFNNVDVSFVRGDIDKLEQLKAVNHQEWDIIISNPPYITPSEKKEMDKQVLKYEPGLALFHESPLGLYKNIIEFSASAKASLFLECNDKLAHQIREVTEQFYREVKLLEDLDGNDRFIIASKSY
jgi:release factor glutamine methyltransferase